MRRAACYLSFFILVLSTAACHSTANNSAPTLENNYWKLIALHGAPVAVFDNQSEPHVILHSDSQRVSGSGGCNRLMGSYVIEKNRVQFSQMASTMMACAQGQEIEHAFLRTLEGKMFWTISGNTLTLMDQEKKPVALLGVVYFH